MVLVNEGSVTQQTISLKEYLEKLKESQQKLETKRAKLDDSKLDSSILSDKSDMKPKLQQIQDNPQSTQSSESPEQIFENDNSIENPNEISNLTEDNDENIEEIPLPAE